jgi:multidrug efflux pump subunit AcrB
MSLNLSAIAVRERAVTLFSILLLVAAGAYAFLMLGRAEDPNFTIKTLTVTTVWPGATAREMQDLVAEPLEKRLQELAWYDRVETTTRPLRQRRIFGCELRPLCAQGQGHADA